MRFKVVTRGVQRSSSWARFGCSRARQLRSKWGARKSFGSTFRARGSHFTSESSVDRLGGGAKNIRFGPRERGARFSSESSVELRGGGAKIIRFGPRGRGAPFTSESRLI